MRYLFLSLTLFFPLPLLAQDLVAKTDAKSPADEAKCFKLPPGFEAQLIASEPDIQKPMQIAFDFQGRLWVTTSHHYPFAVDAGKGTDKLFVLSNFDKNGKAGKIQTFDDKLNIPIGVLPLPDGKSVIVSECGSILKLTDTDGDGKADKREVLYTGFGFKDTHGMTNSFTLMPDGWVYACHGFANQSKTKGTDGHEISMKSGNTFRFKVDGSRIENWSFGQVNPFGMTVDPWLNMYTACCHSKPITQLIHGASYISFNEPHRGLGFAPHVTTHQHGSTGLCGLVWYAADHFPKEWTGVMFLGNCVTSRINIDRIEWKGCTPVAKELPDFLVSSDPWFRPVDLKLGPDGALYVSDFYNKIVGHYEVDLKHPGRDKDRGRVWRIVYTGKDAKPLKMWRDDFAKADDQNLLDDFANPNTTVRLLAANMAATRKEFDGNLGAYINDPEKLTTVSGLLAMVKERHGRMTTEEYGNVIDAGKKNPDKAPQESLTGMTIRAMNTRATWGPQERGYALDCLKSFDKSDRMKRAVVDGMISHPDKEFISPLIEVIKECPKDDLNLRYAARVALRNCLEQEGASEIFTTAQPLDIIIDAALGTNSKLIAYELAKLAGKQKIPEKLYRNVGLYIGKNAGRVKDIHGSNYQFDQLLDGTNDEKTCKLVYRFEAILGLVEGVEFSKQIKDLPINRLLSSIALVQFPENSPELRTLHASIYRILIRHTDVLDRGLIHRALKQPYLSDQKAMQLAFDFLLPALDMNELTSYRKSAFDDNKPISERIFVLTTLSSVGFTVQEATAVRDIMKTAPYAQTLQLAAAMAGDNFGADLLLSSVKLGHVPARLLQEKAVLDRLKVSKVRDLDARVAELTKDIPAPEKRLEALIKTRSAGFAKAKTDPALGKEVFKKQCAICHQINNEGQKIGPQLDGIGIRGLDRLLEDTLDPNRNVDAEFRATELKLIDGRNLIGLVRKDGGVYILVDSLGKEQRIPEKDVEKAVVSKQSAMPANVDALIKEDEYYHLMAYLLQQKVK